MSTTTGVEGQLVDFYQQWNAAFDRRDAEAFVALYADDARLMPPGSEALIGRAAIKAYIEAGFFAAGVEGSEMLSAVTIEAGDHVTDIGTYAITFGGGIEMRGNYMTMFRTDADGQLRACYDIFSPSDLPG